MIPLNKHGAVTVTSFLENIFERPEPPAVRCYRGQSDATWKLQPSVMRGMKPEAESEMFSELMSESPSEFSSDRSMFDKLVRAQHYNLPTRLLDVSLNPLVGLYFACDETKYHTVTGSVQIFTFHEGFTKFPDSDTVSLICNLARLSDYERELIITAYLEIIDDADPGELELFRELPAMKRLCQFVRVEKPYFLDIAQPIDLFTYFFVHSAKNNRRVIAQSGAFIATGLLEYSLRRRTGSFIKDELLIPAADKPGILRELDLLNINSRTMFPEVEFVSRYIRDKWKK
ncbi:FRG domain-containing protein [Rhizobium sp. PP-F2F-G48]|uniref:FRG domain-containing protein n=1 Tax=Rhizobium sp. PP-F2F-G48 TaxID=2135651 RepID=UPI00104A9181|nr:FRG domain-containing protein [Rhizobium sp. PP-F2F-G48]TCM58218.1 FRG domain-containing protein [Rhizobium sp. PP-F2F-G48]